MRIEEIQKRAKELYGNKIMISGFEEAKSKDKIPVYCSVHGVFSVRLDHFLSGHSCPKCGGNFMDTDFFIEKATLIHNNKYDYSKVSFKKSNEKICIICPKHGEFWQTPNSHLSGRGCPKCKNENTGDRTRKTTENFILQSKSVHGDKYDYSKVEYINNRTKVVINCPIHGEFYQTPTHHLSGEGCPKCRYVHNSENGRLTLSEFIERAKEVHKDKYDYSQVNYYDYETRVKIGCPKHGWFWQSPDSHLHSGGCPKCGTTLSKNEDEILNFLKENIGEENIIERDRKTLNGREIDILIPFKNIGIEYNGLYWHSTRNSRIDKNYHLSKTIEAKKKGVSLIQIFEDEYVLHKDIVKSKLSQILKISTLPKIYGRKCVVKEIDSQKAKVFLNNNHIQGFAKSTIYIGAFYENNLIGVMSFTKERKNEENWNLNRMATDINYQCVGVGGKMFTFFKRCYNPTEVKSFADRRWTIREDNLYTKIGFKIDSILPPDYRYYNENINKYERIHKFNFRKGILSKKYGLDIHLTESKMAESLNYAKIWDCGLIKYIWKKEE